MAVHLVLFTTLDFAFALAALLVSVSLSFPLDWLFERANNSIWPPALVHFAVQGLIKLVEVAGPDFQPLAITWMVVSAALPWLFFLLLREPARDQLGSNKALTKSA